MEAKLDSVASTISTTVTDVQSACWQIPVHPDHIERTAVVDNSGNFCCIKVPFGFLLCAVSYTEIDHRSSGHIPELLIYMDGFCVLSATSDNVKSLERMCS